MKGKKFLVAISICVTLLASNFGFTYSFICNSIDANGAVFRDQCGACNDENGPRWVPSSVPVKLDTNTLPEGLSKEVWQNVLTSSLESWNNVSGSNLNLWLVGETNVRDFGNLPSEHEIFWITDVDEWRKKVGSGENGALGVTLAPYYCPDENSLSREIFDGDLALNGLGHFPWKPTCETGEDCSSIRSTLTHELGHLVGLGHPCASCGTSIMSAESGYNLNYPVFDDQEAVRALYPGENSGGFGAACAQNTDCNTGLNCITHKLARYCSKSCSENSPCPKGFGCDKESGDVCHFSEGRLLGAGKVGDSCTSRPCEPGLSCAGSGDDLFFCFSSCQGGIPCGGEKTCIPLQGGGAICVQIAKLEEKCDNQALCDRGLICKGEGDGEYGVCKVVCHPETDSKCPNGDLCVALKGGDGACVANSQGGSENPDKPDITLPRPDITEPGEGKTGGSGCSSWPGSAQNSLGSIALMMGFALSLLRLRRRRG